MNDDHQCRINSTTEKLSTGGFQTTHDNFSRRGQMPILIKNGPTSYVPNQPFGYYRATMIFKFLFPILDKRRRRNSRMLFLQATFGNAPCIDLVSESCLQPSRHRSDLVSLSKSTTQNGGFPASGNAIQTHSASQAVDYSKIPGPIARSPQSMPRSKPQTVHSSNCHRLCDPQLHNQNNSAQILPLGHDDTNQVISLVGRNNSQANLEMRLFQANVNILNNMAGQQLGNASRASFNITRYSCSNTLYTTIQVPNNTQQLDYDSPRPRNDDDKRFFRQIENTCLELLEGLNIFWDTPNYKNWVSDWQKASRARLTKEKAQEEFTNYMRSLYLMDPKQFEQDELAGGVN